MNELTFFTRKYVRKSIIFIKYKRIYNLYDLFFFKIETINHVEKFLKLNNNFILSNFKLKENKKNYSKFIKNNFMITIPNIIFDYNIDGYFAAFLKKIK